MYSASLTPRARARAAIISGVSSPPRMRSALTALARMPSRAVIERVLPHQRQGRGLRQAVGPEIGAGVHRLLRDVEQQAAAGALRPHDAHRVLRDRLMREEIQLEAVAQHLVVDLADAALPGGAGIRDDDIDAAELRRDPVERGAHRRRIGHVAADADPAELLRRRLDAGLGAVEQRDLGAGLASAPAPSRARSCRRRR